MDSKEDTLVSKLWLEGQYGLYQRDVNKTSNCADAIAAVIFLNPKVIHEKKSVAMQINTDINSPEYGRTIVMEDGGTMELILSVDTALYWDFATDVICQMKGNSEDEK